MSESPIVAATESWYGYGRWNAPYWFIGPEPGMRKDEGEELLKRCRAWEKLGSTELMDCREHHQAINYLKWHTRSKRMQVPVGLNSSRPPTQETWRQLIRLLLEYKGDRTDNDAIGDYQCDSWGSKDGEVCAPELSALAARSLSVKRDRVSFREARTEVLRSRIVENAPRFVVMYGGGKTLDPYWNYIASGVRGVSPFKAEIIADWPAGFYTDSQTTYIRASHPVRAGGASPPDAYWLDIARALRGIRC